MRSTRSAPLTKRGMPPERPVRAVERREALRRHVLFPASLLFMRRRFPCRIIEIGTDGICVKGAPRLSTGTPVIIETPLFGRRAGLVAHRTGDRLGVALFGAPRSMQGMVRASCGASVCQ